MQPMIGRVRTKLRKCANSASSYIRDPSWNNIQVAHGQAIHEPPYMSQHTPDHSGYKETVTTQPHTVHGSPCCQSAPRACPSSAMVLDDEGLRSRVTGAYPQPKPGRSDPVCRSGLAPLLSTLPFRWAALFTVALVPSKGIV